MTTIVMNTLTGAVSEYDWNFQSITPTHAGDATGLYELGGDTDAGNPIVARVTTGTTQFGDSRKKRPEMVYFALEGAGVGELTVVGKTSEYAYSFSVQSSGESRCPPGRGIRENALAFGFSNPDGDDFRLDKIEALITQTTNRRV